VRGGPVAPAAAPGRAAPLGAIGFDSFRSYNGRRRAIDVRFVPLWL